MLHSCKMFGQTVNRNEAVTLSAQHRYLDWLTVLRTFGTLFRVVPSKPVQAASTTVEKAALFLGVVLRWVGSQLVTAFSASSSAFFFNCA